MVFAQTDRVVAVVPQIGESSSPTLPKVCSGLRLGLRDRAFVARRSFSYASRFIPIFFQLRGVTLPLTATTLIALCSNSESASDLTRSRRRIKICLSC